MSAKVSCSIYFYICCFFVGYVFVGARKITGHQGSAKFCSAIFVTNSFTFYYVLYFFAVNLLNVPYVRISGLAFHMYSVCFLPVSRFFNVFCNVRINGAGFTIDVMALAFLVHKNVSDEI